MGVIQLYVNINQLIDFEKLDDKIKLNIRKKAIKTIENEIKQYNTKKEAK